MIARPTTSQVLLDCCNELMENVLPTLDPGPSQVRVFMLEGILRNAAARADHEIAWMHEEIDAAIAYARSVREAHDEPELKRALEAASMPPASLHLDDVVEAYDRASEALSCALETAMTAGDKSLAKRGAALLDARMEHEREIMSGWGQAAGR